MVRASKCWSIAYIRDRRWLVLAQKIALFNTGEVGTHKNSVHRSWAMPSGNICSNSNGFNWLRGRVESYIPSGATVNRLLVCIVWLVRMRILFSTDMVQVLSWITTGSGREWTIRATWTIRYLDKHYTTSFTSALMSLLMASASCICTDMYASLRLRFDGNHGSLCLRSWVLRGLASQ